MSRSQLSACVLPSEKKMIEFCMYWIFRLYKYISKNKLHTIVYYMIYYIRRPLNGWSTVISESSSKIFPNPNVDKISFRDSPAAPAANMYMHPIIESGEITIFSLTSTLLNKTSIPLFLISVADVSSRDSLADFCLPLRPAKMLRRKILYFDGRTFVFQQAKYFTHAGCRNFGFHSLKIDVLKT